MACCSCGKTQVSQSELNDMSRLSRSQHHRRGRRKCRWRTAQASPSDRPSVYYVKGSRVPVETLGSDTARDSRFYRDRQRRAAASPCRAEASAEPMHLNGGNPTLLFLLNWQTIPPLARMSVIQRAVHVGNTSMLPVIREGQEAGDSRIPNRRRRPEVTSRDAGSLLRGRAENVGEGEGTWSRGLFRRVTPAETVLSGSFGTSTTDRFSSARASHSAADGSRAARLRNTVRQCRRKV